MKSIKKYIIKGNIVKNMLKIIGLFVLVCSLGYATNPKVAIVKKSVDDNIAKVKSKALEGKIKKFPSICASFDTFLLKYTFPNAPKDIHAYYKNATNKCRGELHTIALHSHLKSNGSNVCRSMEVSLQINHLKSFLKKTKGMNIWNDFMVDYKKTCPKNMNF
jgi:hypothetical protein